MTIQTHWNLINHHLVGKGDLSPATLTADPYQKVLQDWQTLQHPAKFPIETFRVEEDNHVLTVTLDSQILSDYQPYHNIINQLSGMEKLHLLQQSLDFTTVLTARKIHYRFDLSNLWIHRAGVCGWLPLPPPQLPQVATDQVINHHRDFIQLLLMVLGYGDTSVEEWQTLENRAHLPWAWGTFIEDHLTENLSQFPNKLANFRFLFFQAWLYLTANRLAMKNKLLPEAEYVILTRLGQQLGLTHSQMQYLDVIAQQQYPERLDLLTLVALEE